MVSHPKHSCGEVLSGTLIQLKRGGAGRGTVRPDGGSISVRRLLAGDGFYGTAGLPVAVWAGGRGPGDEAAAAAVRGDSGTGSAPDAPGGVAGRLFAAP